MSKKKDILFLVLKEFKNDGFVFRKSFKKIFEFDFNAEIR